MNTRDFDYSLKRLTVALRRLEGSDGRVARRNARRSVGALLGAIRKRMEEEYPPVRNRKHRNEAARAPADLRRRYKRMGFVQWPNSGISLKITRVKHYTIRERDPQGRPGFDTMEIWAPAWALHVWIRGTSKHQDNTRIETTLRKWRKLTKAERLAAIAMETLSPEVDAV